MSDAVFGGNVTGRGNQFFGLSEPPRLVMRSKTAGAKLPIEYGGSSIMI
jgi:hypothetical protein